LTSKSLRNIIIHEAELRDILSLLIFFISLDRDPETRLFYRAYRCDGFRSLWCFLTLIYKLTFKRLRKRFLMVLALREREIVGLCHIDMVRDAIGHFGIVVKPSFRGRGLGKLLAKRALLMIKALHVKHIFLQVDADNSRAIKLYKSLGFRICGYSKDYRYKTNEYVKCYLMKLTL